MDIYQEIEYELWSEKKTKECGTLSAFKVAECFGPEALLIIPKVSRILKKRLMPLKEKLEAIHEEARIKRWDPFILSFHLESVVMLSREQPSISLLEKNKKILTFARRRKTIIEEPTKNPVNLDTIVLARQKPIEGLYSFEKLKKLGNKTQTICPFHVEKTPSFFIYHNNTFHCFSCSANGSAIDFYMKLHNVSFYDAVKALI